jgi:hypothetical protein
VLRSKLTIPILGKSAIGFFLRPISGPFDLSPLLLVALVGVTGGFIGSIYVL